jgi:hypothetical protein
MINEEEFKMELEEYFPNNKIFIYRRLGDAYFIGVIRYFDGKDYTDNTMSFRMWNRLIDKKSFVEVLNKHAHSLIRNHILESGL